MFTGGTKSIHLTLSIILIISFTAFSQHSHAQSGVEEFNAGNYTIALNQWIQELEASPNSPELNYNIGKLFDKGLGTTEDRTTATQYYLNSAKYNYPPAMFSLGVIMAKNENYNAAAKWWLKASAGDLPEAQYNLAKLYAEGRGVEKDLHKAKFWFKKAAQSALTKYDLLSSVLQRTQ